MYSFCTLFDSNYLSRGLTLLDSLQQNCKTDYKLFILATDNLCYDYLTSKDFDNVVVTSIDELSVAYPILEKLKSERTVTEFNWTLSSFSIQYFLKRYLCDNITYIDADLYFYSDPKIIIEHVGNKSVLITPHRYTPKYDQTELSGKYCVQFMFFKNNDDGNRVLEWWRKSCEECCCGVPTDGKFGDQKYLDDWLSRFDGIIYEENSIGCGVAPWNIQQYNLLMKNNLLFIQDKVTKVEEPVIFYHFHGIKSFVDKSGKLLWDINNSYSLDDAILKQLYKSYIMKLQENNEKSLNVKSKLIPNNYKKLSILKVSLLIWIKRIIKTLNYFKIYSEIKNKKKLESF